MKKIISRICGIFMREKGIADNIITDIEDEIRKLVTVTTTEKDIVDRLNTILAAFKFSKFDVYDFKKTLEKLAPAIPQEKMLYTSVLTTSADLGITKADIIQSIRYYSGMLADFGARSKTYVDNLITCVEDNTKLKIEALAKQKEDNKKAIEKLLANNSEIDIMVSSFSAESSKYVSDIKLVRDNIVKVSSNCLKSLKLEKEKCDKHLG